MSVIADDEGLEKHGVNGPHEGVGGASSGPLFFLRRSLQEVFKAVNG